MMGEFSDEHKDCIKVLNAVLSIVCQPTAAISRQETLSLSPECMNRFAQCTFLL
jgi:hypothetical protein